MVMVTDKLVVGAARSTRTVDALFAFSFCTAISNSIKGVDRSSSTWGCFSMFIIDSNGKVKQKFVGFRPADELTKELINFLKSK